MRGHPRANGSASRWKKLSTYTQARSPPPRTLPPLPPPDLDEEGRVDNQRNTPHNTPLTVQLTVATSHRDLRSQHQAVLGVPRAALSEPRQRREGHQGHHSRVPAALAQHDAPLRVADACHPEPDPALSAQVLPLPAARRLHPQRPHQRVGVPQGRAEAHSQRPVRAGGLELARAHQAHRPGGPA